MKTYVGMGFVGLALFFLTSALAAEEGASPSPQPGPAAAAFDRVLGQMKEFMAKMGALQAEYAKADQPRRVEIRAEWKELVGAGNALEPKLIGAAEKAYAEAPGADAQVTDLLVDILLSAVEPTPRQIQTDNYEQALRLGKLLMKHGCKDQRVPGAVGIAAFAIGEFDFAEKCLKQAEADHAISSVGRHCLESIPQYQRFWAEEHKLRAAEDRAGDLPEVLLKTSKGDIKIVLLENEAPNTVANFVSLVEKGFYDGLTFHRVLPGFMAQGGCPEGTGVGGPGYHIPCECHQPNHRQHFRGSLSMAHAGRDTGGSQFFLTFLPTDYLNGRHTVFGRVVDGFDVLHQLQRRDPEKPNPPQPDKIIQAKVLKKRDHPYVPKKVGDEFNQ